MTTVRDFGAKGDGTTDDTDALRHAIENGHGRVVLPRGDYVVRRPLTVPLEKFGRFSLSGEGGIARILWHGSGPLLHLVGTHQKTAFPEDFVEAVWTRERMPTVSGLEILGHGPDSDGIRLEGTMQPTLSGVLIRHCRHGIHIVKRNRNVLIADCHVYDNRGIGIYLDRVNLHQINIHGNHISYCKRGGIVVAGSEVRNIQICSNDIEYNFDLMEPESADLWFDAREGTIREGTVVGNTIQAKFSPGGAVVRFTGPKGKPNAVGMITVSNNLIGSEQTLVHLQSCRGIVVSGNSMYSGERHAILAEDCEHLLLDGNSHDHNSDYKGKCTDVHVFRRCRNVNLTGLLIQHTGESAVDVEASVTFEECDNVSMTGCQIINARRRGVNLTRCTATRIANCTVRGTKDAGYVAPIAWDDATTAMVTNNFLTGELPPARAGVAASGNVMI